MKINSIEISYILISLKMILLFSKMYLVTEGEKKGSSVHSKMFHVFVSED